MPLRLHRDLRRYNDIESKEEAAEESGWKLVHGDVFRAPQRPGLLAVYLGTGVQAHLAPPRATSRDLARPRAISCALPPPHGGLGVSRARRPPPLPCLSPRQVLGMVVVTMCFAVFGFLSPSNRGGLMTGERSEPPLTTSVHPRAAPHPALPAAPPLPMAAMLVLFVIMGGLAGYVSALFYKTFKGTAWKMNTLKTARSPTSSTSLHLLHHLHPHHHHLHPHQHLLRRRRRLLLLLLHPLHHLLPPPPQAFMFPGIVFCIFFVLNLFIWGEKSKPRPPTPTLLRTRTPTLASP